jgi:hypothetical protein
VKNWFEEAIDVGTSVLIRHRPPGPHCQVKYWFQEPFADSTPDKNLSGKYWVAWANLNAKNSTSVDDLAEPFKSNAKAFIKALTDAGASVRVTTTTRSKKRAYLFHWCWLIGLGKKKPSEAKAMPGVGILWDHGNAADSKKAAKEMIDGFGLATPPKSTDAPSLTSNHESGKAIDMNITWTGTIKVAQKNAAKDPVSVEFMDDVNENSALHAVGATYSVIKRTSDAPHWSLDGG